MTLDLSSLQKAINSLGRAIKVADSVIKGDVNTDEEEVIRAGVIHNFEFTYELCWKFMKRWLEINIGGANLDGATRRELFREASKSGLIDYIDSWMEYHGARNETSHTYDNDKAEDVFDVTKNFLKDAKQLLSILEKKND
ncbi:MAG: nucleotidyltransferase substrate binding protein [bacterium]